jgi:hypothetical protein
MKRVLVLALVLAAGVASAQPATPTFRPPTGCTDGQAMVFHAATSRWICGSAGGSVTTSSDFDGDGTPGDPLDLSTAMTAPGTLSTVGIVGIGVAPVAGNQLTVRDSDGDALIRFDAGGVSNQAFFRMNDVGQYLALSVGASTDNDCTLSAGGVWNCVGGLQVNGTNVATTSNISITDNYLARGTGTGIEDSTIADDGTYVYTPSQIWGKWSATDGVALAGGAGIASTTAADVGFDFGMSSASGDVLWRNKLGTSGALKAYVGAGTSPGNTVQWLGVAGTGAVSFPGNLSTNGTLTVASTATIGGGTNQNGLFINGPQSTNYSIRMESTSVPASNGWQFRIRELIEGDFVLRDETAGINVLYIDADQDVTLHDDLTALGDVQLTDTTGENVGIGTSSPSEKLEIVGVGKGIRLFADDAAEDDSNTVMNVIDFHKHVEAGPVHSVRIYNISTFATHSYQGSDLRIAMNQNGDPGVTDRFVFDSTGKFGVGDMSPDFMVDVAGTLGVDDNTWLAADGTGLATADGYGLLAVDSLYAGTTKDIADTFIAGFYRPERGYYYHQNWLSETNDLGGDGNDCAAIDDVWCGNDGTASIVLTEADITSPRGLTETVGGITCTGGTCNSGGADVRYVATEGGTSAGSVPYTDARGLTVTFSVWLKSSSGTPTAVLAVYRDEGVESTTANCAINTSTWTRCSVTKTLSSTDLADDSEIIVAIQPRTTSTVYAYGAQLEESAAATPYQKKTGPTNAPDGLISGFPLVADWPAYDDEYIWAKSALFAAESTVYDGSGFVPHVSIQGSTGTVLAENVGVRTSFAVSGETTLTNTTFLNGPSGINTYDGTHLEWSDEWTYRSLASSESAGIFFTSISSGAVTSDHGGAGRPGVVQIGTSTNASGLVNMSTSFAFVDFDANTTTTFEWVGGFPTLSDGTQSYAALIGFYDASSLSFTDGCAFMYDSEAAGPTPGTGDSDVVSGKWKIVSAENGTRSGYLLDGTASEDSFTTVDSTVAALTWPSTNVYKLKVVVENDDKCRFYINDVEVGRITTNIPGGSLARHTAAGFAIVKSAGTTARTMDTDFTRLSMDLASAR